MPLSEFSFLVLSDIHFGALAEHSDFALPGTSLNGHTGYAESMKSHLVKVVREQGTKIDAILVPGDLTSAACPAEFIGCWEIIEEFVRELNVDPNLVFHTYGNHDINWKISALGKGGNGIAADPHYERVAAEAGNLFCRASVDLVVGPVPGSGVFKSEKFDLFVANSGLFCTNEQEVKHGKLGEKQLTWLESELRKDVDIGKWRILMIHHHPFNSPFPKLIHDISFLEEGDALVKIIGETQIDFVCHGHRHHPVLRTVIENGWQSPCTFFCAGSVSVNATHRAAGNIKNMFHIVTLSERHPSNKGALGRIATYGFTISKGWIPHEPSVDSDLDPSCFFGSVASVADRRAIVDSVLNAALSNAAQPIYLPTWDDLPVDIRFTRYRETANLLSEATGERNLQLFRNYPEDPVVIK